MACVHRYLSLVLFMLRLSTKMVIAEEWGRNWNELQAKFNKTTGLKFNKLWSNLVVSFTVLGHVDAVAGMDIVSCSTPYHR